MGCATCGKGKSFSRPGTPRVAQPVIQRAHVKKNRGIIRGADQEIGRVVPDTREEIIPGTGQPKSWVTGEIGSKSMDTEPTGGDSFNNKAQDE